jgi:hypothetical protein
MNLYLIEQSENDDYGTYDSAVVCAPDEATAKRMHPMRGEQLHTLGEVSSDWVTDPDLVDCTFLGVSTDPKQRVVCASFNAG